MSGAFWDYMNGFARYLVEGQYTPSESKVDQQQESHPP